MYNVHCTCTDRSAQCKCIFIFCIFMCLLIFFFSISRSYSSSSSSSSICSSFCFLLHISWFGFWFQLVSLLRIIVHVQIFNIYKNVGNWIAVVTCLNFLVDFLGRFWWCTPLTAYDTHTHTNQNARIYEFTSHAHSVTIPVYTVTNLMSFHFCFTLTRARVFVNVYFIFFSEQRIYMRSQQLNI